MLLVFLPLLIFVSLCLLVFERSSPFFLQQRLGQKKRVFTIYKLRTMLDGEITIIGKVLRKTGIDEIPQLLNILKGDMSFVGPRPLMESDVARMEWGGDYYKKRWNVRPGITGLAQLSAKCHRKYSWLYDQYYVNNQSFCLDFKVLSLSIMILFLGKDRVKKLIHK